jgi:hypothetical protein
VHDGDLRQPDEGTRLSSAPARRRPRGGRPRVTAERGITVEALAGTLGMFVKVGFSEIARRRGNWPIVRLAL